MKLAVSVTFASSTPRCSTTIFFTRSAMSLLIRISPQVLRCFLAGRVPSQLDGCPASAQGAASYHSSCRFANALQAPVGGCSPAGGLSCPFNRKGVVEGTGGAVRLALGGRRINKK